MTSKDSTDEEIIDVLLETSDLRRERDELRAQVEYYKNALATSAGGRVDWIVRAEAAQAEIARLRIERDVYRSAVARIIETIDEYKRDRMWAYALRKIGHLATGTGIEIDYALERAQKSKV